MASLIKEKPSATGTLTITLGALATSAGLGVGRQSTLVDNSTTQYPVIELFASITLGTNPVANTAVYLVLIRASTSGTPIRDDGAGTTDAAFTALNATPIGSLRTSSAPSTGDVLKGSFIFRNPGPTWGVGVWHDTGVALNATDGNHVVEYIGLTPESQ